MIQATLEATLEIEGTTFRVLGHRVSRALDNVDTALCLLDSTEEELDDVNALLGKTATFTLQNTATQVESKLLGDVVSASDRLDEQGSRFVEVVVAVPAWRLTRRIQSRIFQKQTIQEITEKVLNDAGVDARFEWHGSAHSTKKDYVVQYDESDFDFLRRLLGEVAITFGTFVDGETSVLWFSDAPQKREEGDPRELAFRATFGNDPAESGVTDVTHEHHVRPDVSVVQAYDEHHASLAIEGDFDAGNGSSEIYFPLARVLEPGAAKKAAERLVSAYQGRKKTIRARTRVHDLETGARVSIVDHPYSSLNGDYLITSIRAVAARTKEFSGTGAAIATSEFTAVPVDVQLVPERIPEAPIAYGIQTAITTGPSGEEIHTNEHGEVTYHAHWDREGTRDEHSSRFVRTSQVPTGGSMLLPRMGWEVVVSHHEGDLDRPFVMSRLYNGETMPPYALPEGAMRSSIQTNTTPSAGSSNEIRMDDTKGNEQMMFNASRDMSLQVGNNTTQSVGNDLKVTVGANQKNTIIGSLKSTVGADQSVHVMGNQTTSIATLGVDEVTGTHDATISGNRIQMIGGDHRRDVTGASQVTVKGNSMTAVVGSVTLETEASYTHDVKVALIQVTGGDRSVTIGGAHSETTTAAKVIIAGGTRSLEVGSLAQTVGGAFISQVKGSRTDKADAGWSETAGGQQKIEANNITFEGQMKISLTMGGASITLTPASVSISGTNIKLDGSLVELAPMIMDN